MSGRRQSKPANREDGKSGEDEQNAFHVNLRQDRQSAVVAGALRAGPLAIRMGGRRQGEAAGSEDGDGGQDEQNAFHGVPPW